MFRLKGKSADFFCNTASIALIFWLGGANCFIGCLSLLPYASAQCNTSPEMRVSASCHASGEKPHCLPQSAHSVPCSDRLPSCCILNSDPAESAFRNWLPSSSREAIYYRLPQSAQSAAVHPTTLRSVYLPNRSDTWLRCRILLI